MMLYLPNDCRARMCAEAEKAYPNECCGFMLGHFEGADRRQTEVLPAPNTSAAAEQYHRFVITPEQMIAAEQYTRRKHLDIIGFYHSHPDCPAVPSEYDRSHALPVYSCLIVSVMQGEAAEVHSWQLDAGDGYRTFSEESIEESTSEGDESHGN